MLRVLSPKRHQPVALIRRQPIFLDRSREGGFPVRRVDNT
jgi:hypothetical protein